MVVSLLTLETVLFHLLTIHQVHGNHGHSKDFTLVQNMLLKNFGSDKVVIVNSSVNIPSTHIGVEVGGKRLSDEVIAAVTKLPLTVNGQRIVYRFSIIGHSLGGLFAR